MSAVDYSRLLSATATRAVAPYSVPPPGARLLFEAGLPDPVTFPVDDLVRISEQVLRAQYVDALQYGAPQDGETMLGWVGLRDQLAARMARNEALQVDRSNIMLSGGAASALSVVFEALVDPGDVVAIEVPTWNANVASLTRRGAEMIPLLIEDDDGFSVEHLEAELVRLRAQGRGIKALYTIATFNSPTGVCLSVPRRRAVIELAHEFGFVIVEDNVYRELRYFGDHLPSMLSLDPYGVVLRVDSLSKVLAPGIRIGWVTAPPALINAFGAIRQDLGVGQWVARVVEQYLREDLLDAHISTVVSHYRDKLAVAEASLHEHAAPFVRWRSPEGGFFLWVEVDAAIDAQRVMEHALTEGVLCRAGERFFGEDQSGRQFFRLAYPSVPTDEIERGMAVLGRAIAKSQRLSSG